MALIVQKFGGTSVGTIERIQAVARRVARRHGEGNRLVVVVSAMSGETNRLLELAHQLAKRPPRRELDVLSSSGEQVSAALLAIALEEEGVPCRSFLGHQIRIQTDSAFGRARITEIDDDLLRETVESGRVAVVAGFQGVDPGGNITTLGRGGSDTTAVALAAALSADLCEIYTDVDGVYTSDPRIVPTARKLERISYDEMLELASLGAKVLQIRSVEFAKRYNVPVCVRSSFNEDSGTLVIEEESDMEEVLVSGVADDRNQAKIVLRGVPDQPGLAAKVFGPLAEADIVVDMIIQNASADGLTDLAFTVPEADHERAFEIVEAQRPELGFREIFHETGIVKVSVVGVGMRTHAGVASRMFAVLAREGINIQMISTSEIKVSVVVDAKYAEVAIRSLHDEFLASKGSAA